MPFSSTEAKAAAHSSWARTVDRHARTEPGRIAQRERLEREVDPEGRMSPADRAKAVENLKKARQLAMSAKGVAARQAKRQGKTDAIKAKKDAAVRRAAERLQEELAAIEAAEDDGGDAA